MLHPLSKVKRSADALRVPQRKSREGNKEQKQNRKDLGQQVFLETDLPGYTAPPLIVLYLSIAFPLPQGAKSELQAGIAFSNSSVALVHGMSRPIGAYFHVAHGVSNAALLAVVTEFSLIGNPARYARVAQAMGENVDNLTALEAADLAAKSIRRLIKDIKIPSLQELGVDKEKLDKLAPKMAEDAIASGSPANNPRQATKEEIIELYKLAYSQ